MATLENIQGSSLVAGAPDLSPLLEAFGTKQDRDRAAQEQAAKDANRAATQEAINVLTGGAGAAVDTAMEASLNQIDQVNPAAAQGLRQALEAGDPEVLAALRTSTEEGSAKAGRLLSLGSHGEKLNALREDLQRSIADGSATPEDTARVVSLSNMSEDNLNLELQKMQIIGNASMALIPKPEGIFSTPEKRAAFTRLTATNPRLAEQLRKNEETRRSGAPEGFTLSEGQSRFGAGGEVIASVAKTRAASTPLGQARQDLNAGDITQSEFDQIKKAPTAEFKSSVGKLVGDKQLAAQQFGEGSPQVAAIDAAIKSDAKGDAPKLTDVAGVRKEFTKLSSDFIGLRDAIGKVEQSNLNPSPAGDLALIFNFMKINDPASVVRESEFETAQNATSLPGRLGAAAKRVTNGERLLPEQRQDFTDTAVRLFEVQREKQVQLENSFRSIAERSRMNADDVVIDFIGEGRGQSAIAPPPPEQNAVSTGQTTPEGFEIFQRPDGSTFAVSP